MKRICLTIALALSSIMFFSCLKEQEDLFEESSATRMQKLIKSYKDTLAASGNGWILQYYPVPTKDYGGLNYWLKFDDDQIVSVYTNLNINRDGAIHTSLYDIICEQGPLLTFNTYNDIMHYFTTPSQRLYQGYRSDYEFVIEGYKDGIFTLKGKIYGNIMYLIRLGDAKNPEDYLNGVVKNTTMLIRGDFKCVTDDSMALYFESSSKVSFRCVEGRDTTVVTEPIALTDEGFDLNSDIEVKGHRMRRFRLDYNDGSYVCGDTPEEMRFEYVHPDYHTKYDDLLGEYWCVCSSYMPTLEGMTEVRDSIRCTFRPTDGKKEFLVDSLVAVTRTVKGENGETVTEFSYPEIRLTYNPFIGSFSLIPQVIDSEANIWILAYTGSSWTYSESYSTAFSRSEGGIFNRNADYSAVSTMGTFEADASFITIRQAYCWRCLGVSGSFTIHHWNKIK